jgi:hypothetical protein
MRSPCHLEGVVGSPLVEAVDRSLSAERAPDRQLDACAAGVGRDAVG